MSSYDPIKILTACAGQPPEAIDITAAAIAFAAVGKDYPTVDRYYNHIKKLAEKTAARHQEYLDSGAKDDAGTKLASLKEIIVIDNGYKTLPDPSDDLSDYTFITTIKDHAGPPVFLALLYICVADQLGWVLHALNIPGFFIARIEKNGQRLVFDPAQECLPLQAHDIRNLLKQEQGEAAEIMAHYFNPLSKYGVLIAVQNYTKHQKIRAEDYEQALLIVQAMQGFAPDEYRLLLDAGVLYAKTNRAASAIFALEHYITKTPDPRSRQEALMLINDLRGM